MIYKEIWDLIKICCPLFSFSNHKPEILETKNVAIIIY